MPSYRYEIKKYDVRISGNSVEAPHNVRHNKARIQLYGIRGNSSEAHVGTILFHDKDALGKYRDSLSREVPWGHMRIDDLGAVLDLLRQEKPIYSQWSDGYKRFSLDTGKEDIGEEGEMFH